MGGWHKADEIRSQLQSFEGFWDKLHGAFDAIGFTDQYVTAFERVSEETGRYKNIKDNIWGMMEFSPDEVAVIDSPLFQRLRRVKQTGFTYLTYPSAVHTRFAHSLGVATVVKKFINAMGVTRQRTSSFTAGGERYSYFDILNNEHKSLRRVLTHAALLHDVGHFAFSHAGEQAVKACDPYVQIGGLSIPDFLEVFQDQGFKSDLSECISIAICLSPRFEQWYRKVDYSGDTRARLSEIASLIGGVPHEDHFPGVATIISGQAIDADKIDYINRDARECGIPVGIDISRVFLNSALVDLSATNVEKLVNGARGDRSSKTRSPFLKPGVHFFVNSAGMDSYNEINQAKADLYDRVYLHQFTRSAEQLFSWGLQKRIGTKKTDALDFFALGDEEMISWLTNSKFTRHIGISLRNRNIPRRAMLLFRDACDPFYPLSMLMRHSGDGALETASQTKNIDKDISRWGAWRLWDGMWPTDEDARAEVVRDFIDLLQRQALSARSLVEPGFDPSTYDPSEIYIGFAPRVTLSGAKEVLVRQKNAISTSTQWSKSEELITAESIGRGLDYVYCDEEWLQYVRAALAKVLHKPTFVPGHEDQFPLPAVAASGVEYEFQLLPRIFMDMEAISSRVGFDQRKFTELLYRLSAEGFFEACHRAVPLRDEEMRIAEQVSEKYSNFEGEGGWRVDTSTVAAFVRQFPANLRSEVLDVLKSGVFLSRTTLTSSLVSVFREVSEPGGERIGICRFSSNSGQLAGMLFQADTRNAYIEAGHCYLNSMKEIEDAIVEKRVDRLLFVDDQFASGSQACAQLYYWAGVPQAEWPDDFRDEKNIAFETPTENFQKWLMSGKTTLGFAFGFADGATRIQQAGRDLNFSDLTVSFLNEFPSAAANMSAPLSKFLEEVGISLLSGLDATNPTSIEAAAREKYRKDALGYSGAASVLTTQYNAPSHMVTAFWSPGIHENEPWVPLFIRRGHMSKLVIC